MASDCEDDANNVVANDNKKKPATTTNYQEKVYEVVKQIPAGFVATYGTVSAAVGTGTARSVGGAMRSNPYAPIVPWHRVVASGGNIGGFSGQWATGDKINRKRTLLESEGVLFDDGGNVSRVSFQCILTEIDTTMSSTPDDTSTTRVGVKRAAASSEANTKKKNKSSKKTNNEETPQPTNSTKSCKKRSKTETNTATSSGSNTSSPTDSELRELTLDMVRTRGTQKTCWPSEIPRRIARERGSGSEWRNWMPQTHKVVRTLAKEGKIEITQKGSVCNLEEEIRGPYRIRLAGWKGS